MNYQIRSSQITHERIEGELILISMDSGKYYSATGSAADIFFLIEHKVPTSKFEQILDKGITGFIKEDVEAFVSYILSENLIEDCSQPNLNEVKLPSDYLRNKWVSPNLIEFSDLQDLILVDPVHDASLQGWPVERP